MTATTRISKSSRAAWPALALAFMSYGGSASAADATAEPAAQQATVEQRRAEMPRGVIRLDETVISGNQELPKVLYIVPWQQPDGLPDIELTTEFGDVELFRRLYPPAYRRELGYYEASRATAESNDSEE